MYFKPELTHDAPRGVRLAALLACLDAMDGLNVHQYTQCYASMTPRLIHRYDQFKERLFAYAESHGETIRDESELLDDCDFMNLAFNYSLDFVSFFPYGDFDNIVGGASIKEAQYAELSKVLDDWSITTSRVIKN